MARGEFPRVRRDSGAIPINAAANFFLKLSGRRFPAPEFVSNEGVALILGC